MTKLILLFFNALKNMNDPFLWNGLSEKIYSYSFSLLATLIFSSLYNLYLRWNLNFLNYAICLLLLWINYLISYFLAFSFYFISNFDSSFHTLAICEKRSWSCNLLYAFCNYSCASVIFGLGYGTFDNYLSNYFYFSSIES